MNKIIFIHHYELIHNEFDSYNAKRLRICINKLLLHVSKLKNICSSHIMDAKPTEKYNDEGTKAIFVN